MIAFLRRYVDKIDKNYCRVFQDLMKTQVKVFQLLDYDKKIEYMQACKLSHPPTDFYDPLENTYERWWNYVHIIDCQIVFKEEAWLNALDIEFRVYIKREIVPELFNNNIKFKET
jgi:hypothetical protein